MQALSNEELGELRNEDLRVIVARIALRVMPTFEVPPSGLTPEQAAELIEAADTCLWGACLFAFTTLQHDDEPLALWLIEAEHIVGKNINEKGHFVDAARVAVIAALMNTEPGTGANSVASALFVGQRALGRHDISDLDAAVRADYERLLDGEPLDRVPLWDTEPEAWNSVLSNWYSVLADYGLDRLYGQFKNADKALQGEGYDWETPWIWVSHWGNRHVPPKKEPDNDNLEAEDTGQQQQAQDGRPPIPEPTRPTVWLLQYKDQDRPDALFRKDNIGDGIEWRSTRIVKGIEPGDPVIYWRSINRAAKDRGGLVGTGRFLGGKVRSQEQWDPSKNKNVVWHYYPTRFEELRPDELLGRDSLIDATGLKLNYGHGSILKVPSGFAEQIHDYLISNHRKGLFDEPKLIAAASEVTFIGDSPKFNQDFLNRAELAFVLAARLNRVWDETNAEEASGAAESLSRWERIRRWLHRRQPTSSDAGFVVHIDAPWGGGKTTFANYIVRILNSRGSSGDPPEWFARLPLDDEQSWPVEFHRLWHVVTFNAWQQQHVDPPWWCFYQAIRRGCFRAVRTEVATDRFAQKAADEHGALRRAGAWIHRRSNACGRHFRWFRLWMFELAWRLFNPKVNMLLVTFALTWVAALVLASVDLFDTTLLKDPLGEGLANLPTTIATALIILLGGATAIWSVFATVTESLLPGTPDAAKNYSLGSGDPLDRFRIHFDRMMRRIARPIIVVVDDIDRCEPSFVVELLRGMQTILRSPRVIFMLLGDRDWIEQSFTHVHKAMKEIDVGPEHSFGGRFVEKAIQQSLVLPDVSAPDRTEYVQTLLGVRVSAAMVSDELPEAKLEEERNRLNAKLDTILETPDAVSRDAEANSLRQSVNENETIPPEVRESVVKDFDRRLAMRSATDEKAQQAIQHRLAPLAPVLPANPRQIKRIINGISLFQEIARIQQAVQPGSSDWRKLALWIVVMTEWPRTWATISKYPGLIDLVHSRSGSGDLPPADCADAWSKDIRANRPVMNLIDFQGTEDGWPQTQIDTATVKRFRTFLPATSGEMLPLPRQPDPSASGVLASPKAAAAAPESHPRSGSVKPEILSPRTLSELAVDD